MQSQVGSEPVEDSRSYRRHRRDIASTKGQILLRDA